MERLMLATCEACCARLGRLFLVSGTTPTPRHLCVQRILLSNRFGDVSVRTGCIASFLRSCLKSSPQLSVVFGLSATVRVRDVAISPTSSSSALQTTLAFDPLLPPRNDPTCIIAFAVSSLSRTAQSAKTSCSSTRPSSTSKRAPLVRTRPLAD